MIYSEQDLTVRAQLIGIEYSNLVNTYVNDLKWGKKAAKTEWKKLILLQAYITLLENYDITSDKNCITETQLTTMLNQISKLTGLCFKPAGYTYHPITDTRQFDNSFDNSFL
jgi:hypothetical protein